MKYPSVCFHIIDEIEDAMQIVEIEKDAMDDGTAISSMVDRSAVPKEDGIEDVLNEESHCEITADDIDHESNKEINSVENDLTPEGNISFNGSFLYLLLI